MSSIALFHFAYPPNLGGVEILMREHATILNDLGFQITVVTGSGKSDVDQIKVLEDPLFGSLYNSDKQLQDNIFAGVFDHAYEARVEEILSALHEVTKDIDTIIVHNMMTVSRNLAFVEAFHSFARTTDKKIIVYIHDHMYVRDNQSIDLSRVTSDKEKQLITQKIPNTTYVCISQALKNALMKIMKPETPDIVVIPNGINVHKFLEIDDSVSEIADKIKLSEKFPIVLAPVNLIPRKRIEYSLEIVHHLKKEYPNICFLISGKTSKHRDTDSYSKDIRDKILELGIAQNVFFLSEYIERSFLDKEIHDLYTLSDVVFYFSRHENFGIPILEAPLTKTPIFVSDLEVFHEIANSLLQYIDPNKVNPKDASKIVNETLSSDLLKLNRKVRSNYNLKTILNSKLLPLLNS